MSYINVNYNSLTSSEMFTVKREISNAKIDPDKVRFNEQGHTYNVQLCEQKYDNLSIDVVHCYCYFDGQKVTIPSYHPHRIHKGQWNDVFWLRLAFHKANTLANCTYYPFDNIPGLQIRPTLEQVIAHCDILKTQDIGVDIETTRACEISSIALVAIDGGICVPFIVDGVSYWSKQDERIVLQKVQEVLLSEKKKVFHNYIFDVMYLSKYGIEVGGEVHDTMIMAHLINPKIDKGLADLGRIYSYSPEWKSKGEWQDIKDWDEFWMYNALDSWKTLSFYLKQDDLLDKLGRRSIYTDKLQPLIEIVYSMCAKGWNINHDTMNAEKEEVKLRIAGLEEYFNGLASEYGIGETINMRSPVQVKKLITSMGFDLKYRGKESTDDYALARLELKHKDPVFTAIRNHREKSRYISSYLNATLDDDLKFRFSLKIPGTVTARFSSSMTAWDTGGNAQNQPPEFKKHIIPDKGKILIETDLQRADAQVVAWLSNDHTLQRVLNENIDIHTFTANAIFGCDITKLSPAEYKLKRAIGKRSNHALNYGMSATHFALDLLKSSGISITDKEAEDIIKKYFSLYPGVLNWHSSIRAQLGRTRQLTSPHGRVCTFYGPLERELYKAAYAYIPPTTVGDSINETMIRIYRTAAQESLDLQILGQIHDSILMQVEESKVKTAIELINDSAKKSVFNINNKTCCIPNGIMVGYNWGTMEEYK